jgi:hypothetical protein
MKTITVSASSLAARSASKAKARAVVLSRSEETIARLMSNYGLSYAAASDFVNGRKEASEARRAERASSWLPLPAPLAAAILADFTSPSEPEKISASGKAYKPMKGGLVAYRLASISARTGQDMVATPVTIATLSKAYGLDS